MKTYFLFNSYFRALVGLILSLVLAMGAINNANAQTVTVTGGIADVIDAIQAGSNVPHCGTAIWTVGQNGILDGNIITITLSSPVTSLKIPCLSLGCNNDVETHTFIASLNGVNKTDQFLTVVGDVCANDLIITNTSVTNKNQNEFIGTDIIVTSPTAFNKVTIPATTRFGFAMIIPAVGSLYTASVCNSGTAQVALNGSTLSNICPSNTVNLNSLVNGTAPTGSGLVWFTNANHTGTAYATPATAGAGSYFAFFYDATNDCYNTDASTSSITVTINSCGVCPTTAPTLSATSAIICPGTGGAVNLNNFVSSTAPAGAVPVWKDASGTTITNTTAVSTTGVYTATYFNAVLNCSSPASVSITLSFLPNPVPTSSTINICSPATTANLTNVVTAPSGSGYVIEWYDGVNFDLQTPAQVAAEPPGDYYVYFRSGATCYNNADIMVTVTNNPATCSTVAGTIDCSKTLLTPAPVFGTARQLDLVVTVNVTTAGCFTPITVSGSGFTLATGITQICATSTGIQQLHIPVNYDGTTLGTLSFTIGQAGACNADLTKPPKQKEISIWTLDNCTLKNTAPGLK